MARRIAPATRNSLRSSGQANGGSLAPGTAIIAGDLSPACASGTAAGQCESSKSGAFQFAATLAETFHEASMRQTNGSRPSNSITNLPANPAGRGGASATATAKTFRPATKCQATSITWGAVRALSPKRLAGFPLTNTS